MTTQDERTRLRQLVEAGDIDALWAWLRWCERANDFLEITDGLQMAYAHTPDTARVWLKAWYERHDPRAFSAIAQQILTRNAPCERSRFTQQLALDLCALVGACPWFIHIPAGQFWMGASPGDTYAEPFEQPRHLVQISHALWVASTPITQGQWSALIGSDPQKNPSDFQLGPAHPVERVTWLDAQSYCAALAKALGVSSWRIGAPSTSTLWDHLTPGTPRLPTSAEWEFFARAGSEAPFYNSSFVERACDVPDPNLEPLAWYQENARGKTHPVAQKLPNAWGLYDTLGNVDEWVWDWSGGDYPASSNAPNDPPTLTIDPTGPAERGRHATRTIRGGSWFDVAAHCRVSYRRGLLFLSRNRSVGFRCVVTAAS